MPMIAPSHVFALDGQAGKLLCECFPAQRAIKSIHHCCKPHVVSAPQFPDEPFCSPPVGKETLKKVSYPVPPVGVGRFRTVPVWQATQANTLSSVMPRALAWELCSSDLKHCESVFESNIATDSYGSIHSSKSSPILTPIDTRKYESAGRTHGFVPAPTNTASTTIMVVLFLAHPRHIILASF